MVDVVVQAAVDVAFEGGNLGVQPVLDFLVAGPGEVSLELFVVLVDCVSQLGFIVGYDFTSYCFLLERG